MEKTINPDNKNEDTEIRTREEAMQDSKATENQKKKLSKCKVVVRFRDSPGDGDKITEEIVTTMVTVVLTKKYIFDGRPNYCQEPGEIGKALDRYKFQTGQTYYTEVICPKEYVNINYIVRQ